MAYAIGIIRYRRPLEEVQEHRAAHRAYISDLHDRGIVVAAGPLDPMFGGAVIFSVPDEGSQATLDALVAADPYVIGGVAQYEVLGWNPIFGEEKLR